MLNQLSFSAVVTDSGYQISLMATEGDGAGKSIRMPIPFSSADGLMLADLIARTWEYMPGAAPDELSQAKARKLQSIGDEWLDLEALGWDSGKGFHLSITAPDVALLVGAYVLAREASALGLDIPAIIAKDNSRIQFATLGDMTILLLRYGQARSGMADTFADRRKSVALALTVEEVDAI